MRVITYGRFDIFHVGHLNLLEFCKTVGDYLVVGLSTDFYCYCRGKPCVNSWHNRYRVLQSCKLVDYIIPEMSYWDEKEYDIKWMNIDVVVLGEEYIQQRERFSQFADVIVHRRTPGISATLLKGQI